MRRHRSGPDSSSAPSGGNAFKGSAEFTAQPLAWNDDNLSSPSSPNATPTVQGVRQLDLTLGGPIVRDHAWFFGSFRYDDLENGIARQAINLTRLKAFKPDFEPFPNSSTGYLPFVKLTSRLRDRHDLSAFYQYDRSHPTQNLETFADPIQSETQGGSLVSGKVNSTWGDRLMTAFQVSWNDKTVGANQGLEGLSGPQVNYHENVLLQGGRLVGTGTLATGGNRQFTGGGDVRTLMVRGDLTYFREGWAGSHELKTGFFVADHRLDTHLAYVNDGFILEQRRPIDPANPAAGTLPFRRQLADPLSLQLRAARERDRALYVQDTWKPRARLTVSAGVRVDFVKRHDAIFNIDRMTDTAVGPRVGVSYLVTRDARNVLRLSAGRIHEQVNARDNVSSVGQTSRVGFTDLYDLNSDGIFETRFMTPPVTAGLTGFEFDPSLHQPWADEFVVGYQRQFPGRLVVDASAMRWYCKDVYAQVDVNGMYPAGPFQPFIGFGRVDPARGILFQETNNTWNTTVYSAFDLTVSKDVSTRLRVLGAFHYQWQRLDGTWNPTDPARFIQPDAFPISKGIPPTRGNRDQNSLTTTTGVSQWPPYRVGIAATYAAPWNLTVAGSLNIQAGEWTAPIQTRLAAADPRFGPPTVPTLGGPQSNPLATVIRFAFPTREEGQQRVPAVRFLNLRVGWKYPLRGTTLVAAWSVFNVFNEGRFYQFNLGGAANQQFSPNFLQQRNLQSARAVQASLGLRF